MTKPSGSVCSFDELDAKIRSDSIYSYDPKGWVYNGQSRI